MAQLASIWVFLILLYVLGCCQGDAIPRVSFPTGSPGRSVTHFTSPEIGNSTTLLLSSDGDTLFVGARDAILSLDVSEPRTMDMMNKVDWSPTEKDLSDCAMKGKKKTDCPNFIRVLEVLNSTHMYACGTFAFSPRCTYINSETFSLVFGPSGKPDEGRGRCPYDPYQRNTAITVDGELYTGTVADYRGNRPVISRHLSEGSHVDLKLDDTLGWLEDPTFISSSYVPSEEKVYFFFSEVGREYDFIDKLTVSRVAQVCTSDVGGQRTLQRRWTTFAKAQLLCQSQGELPYNVLEDMFTLQPPEGAPEEDTLFYGIFSSQWSVNSGRSAVCVFSLDDIGAVFSGNYKVLNRDTLRWSTRVQEKVANPGSCGLHNASDSTLRFVKENFLTDESVQPSSRKLSMVSPDYSYSNIAVQRVRGAKGRNYTVLYLLTESGYLHKTVLLEKGPHIIEEVQVFRQPQPIKNLLLSIDKGSVFVGSSEGVSEVPVANCSFYSGCAECVLARDPFCGWDPSLRICTDIANIQANAAQDVEKGNVLEECKSLSLSPRSSFPPLRPPTGELKSVTLNEVVHLQCPEASRLARRHWERPNSRLSPDLYLQQDDGSLRFLATPITLGHYLCLSVENGFQQVLSVYQVKQKSSAGGGGGGTTSQPMSAVPSRTTQDHQPNGEPGMGPLPTTAWGPRRTEGKVRDHEATPTLSPRETAGVTPHKGSRNFTLWLNPVLQAETETETKLKGRGGVTPAKGGSGGVVGEGVEKGGGAGEQLLQTNMPSYLQELVVVSVLLVLSVSMLLTVALYGMRQRCRSRTAPQACARRDAERGAPANTTGGTASTQQEREALKASPRETKRNGQAHNSQVQNGGKSPVTLSKGVANGSNGHLPNTPI
ncbi:semaphorin-4A isoform X2 [Clupea harengus]|uniref:Semaphorin-4A isoform X2 n=1 Tax=Clupea harengus TaxID=7950 RepID=A0A6P3VYN9_CLUHA|nr:semaphorin-4A isoform X2 [Clupea harengus]